MLEPTAVATKLGAHFRATFGATFQDHAVAYSPIGEMPNRDFATLGLIEFSQRMVPSVVDVVDILCLSSKTILNYR